MALPATAGHGSHWVNPTGGVPEHGAEGIEKVRELTGGQAVHAVLEAVGSMDAYATAVGIVRHGGVISRVGLPQYEGAAIGFGSLFGPNITLTGGPAPVRAYIDELPPGVLDGTAESGRVFDQTIGLEQVPDGYRAMDERTSLKVLIRP
ncbi:Threonine dehydrogenase and related Zn-dependent dehydrogenases [[Actinomadura] parvosata subsp. kistnae]|uniref:zinc-binding dehydrogenase n=1 Tax=[Actinomadura] parvosata TaxID=1955412 RepID=UPI0009ACDB88|nr:zinc-binding dehydrogenase [Nonomuraea sp. ATCC 55076]SPL95737.1 Threonine dehydrogenase and related Zn-dependent dehydrogenases [Actinomadura parvosata subsp. kistnae]